MHYDLLLSTLQILLTLLSCICEEGNLETMQEQAMTIFQKTVGLAAALGTSALAFALTLA